MEIQRTRQQDLDQIRVLYAAAREFMCTHGNPTQWVEGYPERELLERETAEGKHFTCWDGDEIAGVFSFILGEDPTYGSIYDGTWLNAEPYGTVHRICVGKKGRGVGEFCLQWCMEQCGNVRVDTHRDNLPMQALIRKCGYTYCGWVIIEDGTKRLAFQKVRS